MHQDLGQVTLEYVNAHCAVEVTASKSPCHEKKQPQQKCKYEKKKEKKERKQYNSNIS